MAHTEVEIWPSRIKHVFLNLKNRFSASEMKVYNVFSKNQYCVPYFAVYFVHLGSHRNTTCLITLVFIFVKVEVGRKKKAEDVSDLKLLIFAADGVDAC